MTVRPAWHTVGKSRSGSRKPVSVETRQRRKPRASFGLDALPPASEDEIQTAIVDWLRLVLPTALVFHVANGGLRSKSEAARFKKIGVIPGIPDLILWLNDGSQAAFEVKSRDGVLSNEQREIHHWMRNASFRIATVRSVEDVRETLAAWEIQTREAKS